MKTTHWITPTLVLGMIAVLLAGPTAVDAGAPVGSTFVIRAESTEPAMQPAIAYNSQWQEYLVVFWNDRPGCDDIRAERVSRTGQLLGGRWIAAGCPNEHRYPDVAYNTQRNEYLIVWAEESSGYSYVRTQRFTADLQPMPEGQQTLITGIFSMYTSINPAVAYASNSDKYLVVWELEVNMPPAPMATSIAGHAVGGNGVKDPAGSFNVSLDPSGQHRQLPAVAYNRHANGFLVVWQQWDGASVWDVYGQLVHGDGSPPTPSPIPMAWYIQSSMTPAVAAIPTAPGAYKYLVVWVADVGAGDIYGKLVEENGTPHPAAFPIANDPAGESYPAVAGTEYGFQYLVTWRLSRGVADFPIVGRAVSYAGMLVTDPAEFPGSCAAYPAVAAGPAGDFLVAWQDQPVAAPSTNIYGQLWGNQVYVYLPLTLRNK